MSRHGRAERPLCKTVKDKSLLHWRPKVIGGPRSMGYLPRGAAYRAWNQLKIYKCVPVSKVRREV